MGFFDWFRKKPKLSVSVWLDEASQLDALVRGVEADLRRSYSVMVTAHFRAALLQAGERLAQAGVPFTTKATWSDSEARTWIAQKQPSVIVVPVAALPSLPPGLSPPEVISGSRVHSLRVADLHILADENAKVERYARSLPCPVQLSSSISFESPLMQSVASPAITALMQRMGLKPGQSIESKLVSSALLRAMQKLERGVTGNHPADSIAEWLQRNRPA